MFMHQTFSTEDIPKVLLVIFLECILSSDNALAIASIIRPLPINQRNKALFIGLASSFVTRIIAILFISYFIKNFWIKLIGGFYLILLSIFQIKNKKKQKRDSFGATSLIKTILLLELVDIIFALDSILAAFSVSGIKIAHEALSPKLWIVYFGGLLGLVLMRVAAKFFARLMDFFPRLESCSHFLIGLIGFNILYEIFSERASEFTSKKLDGIEPFIFWFLASLIILIGFSKKKKETH